MEEKKVDKRSMTSLGFVKGDPSFTYAREKGLKTEIITKPDGSQYGIVYTPQGPRDTWKFFRSQRHNIPIQQQKPVFVNILERQQRKRQKKFSFW